MMQVKKRLPVQCLLVVLTLLSLSVSAQKISKYRDSTVLSTDAASVSANSKTGRLNFHFSNGVTISNAVAYINELSAGYITTSACKVHLISTDEFTNAGGNGIRMTIRHSGNTADITLIQQILIYQDHPYLFTNLTAIKGDGTSENIETRDISALAILLQENARLTQPGAEPRFLDVPFDNDNWSHVIENSWDKAKPFSGISYEYASIYDNTKLTGLVVGSLSHDFWKTGISYHAATTLGVIDSLKVTDGVATEDNAALPPDYGGNDGTHDHTLHGTMIGKSISSSIIYLGASDDIRKDFVNYGKANVQINGSLGWKAPAPVYWNSFGVEGVLGYEKVMMPKDVSKIYEAGDEY
jgi:outer membrane protein W